MMMILLEIFQPLEQCIYIILNENILLLLYMHTGISTEKKLLKGNLDFFFFYNELVIFNTHKHMCGINVKISKILKIKKIKSLFL